MIESQSKPFNSQEKHELSFERAKKPMTTAIETNHFEVNEKVYVCSDTSYEGSGFAYGNFESDPDGQKLFRICGIGSKTLPERLKPQSTKIKKL